MIEYLNASTKLKIYKSYYFLIYNQIIIFKTGFIYIFVVWNGNINFLKWYEVSYNWI